MYIDGVSVNLIHIQLTFSKRKMSANKIAESLCRTCLKKCDMLTSLRDRLQHYDLQLSDMLFKCVALKV